MKTRLKMLISQKAFETVAIILGVLFLGALGMAPWGILVGILAVYFVLNYGLPSKYTPHVATLEMMLVIGGLVALVLIAIFKDVDSWAIWVGVIWLAISLATSMFWPLLFLTKAEDKNSMSPLGRPSDEEDAK